jgi:CubicO group peptidase (beta-lactamase class C family)
VHGGTIILLGLGLAVPDVIADPARTQTGALSFTTPAAISPEAAIAEIERTLDARLVRTDQHAPAGLPAQMRQFGLPAVSMAVIHQGRIHWARAWGEARPGVAATTETRFAAGSISKSVAALAALRFAEASGVDLDRDLRSMLRGWQPAAEEGPSRYTLRRLLSHSASLSTPGFGGYAVDTPLPTLPQVLDGLPPANSPAVRPLDPAVMGFRYSGGGTTIVQLWMEEQTGMHFAQAMQAWVLKPLGMAHSHFDQPPREAIELHAFAHPRSGQIEPGGWRVYPEAQAAGLWSTPSDIARVLIAVQAARGATTAVTDASDARPLSAAVARSAIQRATDRTSPGFFLDGGRFGHNGSLQGFESAAMIGTETADGLVIMFNSQNTWPVLDAVVRTVARIYGWPEMAAPRMATQQKLPPDAARWAGSYTASDGSVITLRTAAGALWLQPGIGAWERLIRTTDNRFTTAVGQPLLAVSEGGLRGFLSEFGEPLDSSVLSPRRPLPAKPPAISMRGSLSNWQPGAVLKPSGRGRFVTELDVPAGRHEFKIADAQWQSVNLGASGTEAVTSGQWTELAWRGGNLVLEAEVAGRWRLELHAPDRPVPPQLRLTRLVRADR